MCPNELQSLIKQGIVIQVPPQTIDNKTLYEHTDGYFITALGHRLSHVYMPNRPSLRSRRAYPKMRHFGNRDCHYLSACTFYHIPDRAKGEQVDHINGDLLNYSKSNIRIVHKAINSRDGGFLTKLRNQKIDPTRISKTLLLRYFARMAKVKGGLSERKYYHLTKSQLLKILYASDEEFQDLACTFLKF